MAKPPDDASPVSGVSRRTFLKTAGVGAAATSLIGAAPGASGPAVLGPDAVRRGQTRFTAMNRARARVHMK